jgi:hypothetical protein
MNEKEETPLTISMRGRSQPSQSLILYSKEGLHRIRIQVPIKHTNAPLFSDNLKPNKNDSNNNSNNNFNINLKYAEFRSSDILSTMVLIQP